jgi:uncharacterized protein (TIGR00369 family)
MDPALDVITSMPFAARCGIVLVHATKEEVRGELPFSPEICTAGGILHGGVIMTFADTLGAMCAFLNLPPGALTATVESKTNFFRAMRKGTARGTSRPLHVGRTFIVVQTNVVDDDGKSIAQVTQTQAVLQER